MQNSQIDIHQFPNGMVLISESMPWLETAAFSISLPAGVIHDPQEQLGLASVTSEVCERGCGNWSSREFLEQTEILGAVTNNSVSTYSTSYSGASISNNFFDLLKLYSDLTRSATLPEKEVEPSIKSCGQELYSQHDDLAQQTMIGLRNLYFGETLGRWPDGNLQTLQNISHHDIQNFYQNRYRPNNTILSVAGNVDFEKLKDLVADLWGDWESQPDSEQTFEKGTNGYRHQTFQSEQTHIAFAGPAIPFGSDEYYLLRCAIGVLGDGMSSRLFQEVREKRGLCYSVFSGLHTMKGVACITAYAGTTAQRSQETYDVMIEQFEQLSAGVTEEELSRLKVQMRTSLMGQQESCRSRTAAIAGDWFYLNRVRTKAEIDQLISEISADAINEFLSNYPIEINTVSTIGPSPLETKHELIEA